MRAAIDTGKLMVRVQVEPFCSLYFTVGRILVPRRGGDSSYMANTFHSKKTRLNDKLAYDKTDIKEAYHIALQFSLLFMPWRYKFTWHSGKRQS